VSAIPDRVLSALRRRHRLRPLWYVGPLEAPERTFTGNCTIREHTCDGAFAGRCWHATYDGFCPRHGALEDYPTNDDREVRVEDRRHA
jgi:hypothetical protein